TADRIEPKTRVEFKVSLRGSGRGIATSKGQGSEAAGHGRRGAVVPAGTFRSFGLLAFDSWTLQSSWGIGPGACRTARVGGMMDGRPRPGVPRGEVPGGG